MNRTFIHSSREGILQCLYTLTKGNHIILVLCVEYCNGSFVYHNTKVRRHYFVKQYCFGVQNWYSDGIQRSDLKGVSAMVFRCFKNSQAKSDFQPKPGRYLLFSGNGRNFGGFRSNLLK